MEELLKVPVVKAARFSANKGLETTKSTSATHLRLQCSTYLILERFLSEEKGFLLQSKLRQGVAIKARHSFKLLEKWGDTVQVM